ncbi:MAG: galactose oxidase-like domain-containing protein [Pseudomonadota bacterium]
MAFIHRDNPWLPPLGALAAGCFSVVVGFTVLRGPATPEVDAVPRTGALLAGVAEFQTRIRSVHSGLCATLDIVNQNNGNPVVQNNCATHSLQRWTVEQLPDGDARYRVRRHFDGKCLEANADTAVSPRVHVWTCHQGDTARPTVSENAQLWTLEAINGTDHRIRSVATGEVLVLQGSSYTTGAPLTLRAASGSSDESWAFDDRVNTASDLAVRGQWGPLFGWPFVPVHVAMLPDNRMLSWSSNERDEFKNVAVQGTHSAVYDIETGSFSETYEQPHDMFCAGISLLADGRVLASGGNTTTYAGSVFNPDSSTWESGGTMRHARWYGTQLTLSDGDAFATFARRGQEIPERFSPADSTWTEVPGASMVPLRNEQDATNSLITSFVAGMQWYAFMHVAPDGRIIQTGPTQTLHWFDPNGVGSVEDTGLQMARNRQFGAAVMYRPGKILVSGGADPIRTDATSEFGNLLGGTETAVTVDVTGANPVVTPVESMRYARVQHNAVVLPNGEVLVVGGDAWGKLFSDRFAVHESEIWNPDTETWRTADSVSTPRTYHSWAILMQDGRVMSGGGGLCGTCGVNHRTAQVFTPPYLYNADGSAAARPALGTVSATLHAGESLYASVGSTASEPKFALVRLSSVTHSINSDQRWIPLTPSTLSPGVFQLDLPSNPNVLIPGHYWLFAYDDTGTPSMGHLVQIEAGQRNSDSPPVVPSAVSLEIEPGTAVDLTVSLFEPDGQSVLFTVDALPPGLTLDRATGRIAGVVTDAIPSTRFSVSDGQNTVEGVITWRVATAGKASAGGGAFGLAWLVAGVLCLGARRRRAKPWPASC